MMESPFKNDPFAMIYQAFKRLYSDKQCDIWWDTPKEADKQAFGVTNFPDDRSGHKFLSIPITPYINRQKFWRTNWRTLRLGQNMNTMMCV